MRGAWNSSIINIILGLEDQKFGNEGRPNGISLFGEVEDRRCMVKQPTYWMKLRDTGNRIALSHGSAKEIYECSNVSLSA